MNARNFRFGDEVVRIPEVAYKYPIGRVISVLGMDAEPTYEIAWYTAECDRQTTYGGARASTTYESNSTIGFRFEEDGEDD